MHYIPTNESPSLLLKFKLNETKSCSSLRHINFVLNEVVSEVTISAESFSSCKCCKQTSMIMSNFPEAQADRNFPESSAES